VDLAATDRAEVVEVKGERENRQVTAYADQPESRAVAVVRAEQTGAPAVGAVDASAGRTVDPPAVGAVDPSAGGAVDSSAGEDAEYWHLAIQDFATERSHELWRRHSDRINRELLERWLVAQPAGLVLKTDLFDEAVSEGLVPFLEGRADGVVGIDVSQFVLTNAGQRFPRLRAVSADVRQLPFEDGCFDRIVSLSTLDHFNSHEEIVHALEELSRILRPGGELLLTLDNLANPLVRLRNALPLGLLHRLGIVPYYVGPTCGPRRLQAHVREASLQVMETTAVMHAPRVLAVALARWLRSRAGASVQDSFLEALRGFERLRAWPTRFLTGYFIAVRAMKPAEVRPDVLL
jgi:SAM-dependent methyltransferase